MTDKIQMTSIHFVVGWGDNDSCGREATVSTWDDATAQLNAWDRSFGSALHGIDYRVTFEDGFTHTGTVQLGGSYPGGAFNEKLAAGIRSRFELVKGSFLDKTGENREQAIVVGAKYDYGCNTSEPAIADLARLVPFLEANAGADVSLSIAGREDVPVLIFNDGDQLLATTQEEAEYLVRQWRIMNNIHPFLGGEVPLVEPATASTNTI